MTKIEDIRLSSGDLIKMGLTFPQVEVVILQRVEDFPVLGVTEGWFWIALTGMLMLYH
jgi:hypothetical protein